MDSNKDNINIEQLFRDDLHQYLLSIGMVDERLPEAQDIEELWQKLAGRKVAFRPEATGAVVVRAAAAAPVPVADDFENDPGIEAAVELFGATLEPEEKKKS